MHITVCMKQVIDLEQIRIRPDTREPVLEGLSVKFGDFDKNALEAAVRIKESGEATKVTVIASGSPKLKDTVKEALAMGADEAFLLIDPTFEGADAGGSARLLATAVEKLGDVDLVLLGEGSDDEYSGQIPARLAETLGWPQITYVREMEILAGERIRAVQDLEDELEVFEVEPPVVLGVTSELNEPRLPPLTAILKAASKPVHEWTAADLNTDAQVVGAGAAQVEILSNLAPEQDRKGLVYEDVDQGITEIIKALRHEGVLEQ
ncbi:MAG: electron transfer flavoprotein beta subunit/FixA family protein [Anaerolineales bacterium]|nr:electron transfer flavoprotein beta subunit/FixA family protein [Anaerolineales bacterium]